MTCICLTRDAGPKPHIATGFSRLRREKPARALHRRASICALCTFEFGITWKESSKVCKLPEHLSSNIQHGVAGHEDREAVQ